MFMLLPGHPANHQNPHPGVKPEDMEKPEFQLAHQILAREIGYVPSGNPHAKGKSVPEGWELHDFCRRLSRGTYKDDQLVFENEKEPENLSAFEFDRALKAFDVPPPCAFWNIWTGREIEGSQKIGDKTLFVRSFGDDKNACSPLAVFHRAKGEAIRRVWFCEEYMIHGSDFTILDALDLFNEVAICINLVGQRRPILPQVLSRARIYYKCDMTDHYLIKSGDVVCFGKKFADEAFSLSNGQGNHVEPEQYGKDEKWF